MTAELKATGRVSITLVMNLKRFIKRDGASRLRPSGATSADIFDRLRGSQEYVDFLKNLRPARFFEADSEEARLEAQGHALGIFRRHLIDSYFFPTYTVTEAGLEALARQMHATEPGGQQLRAWTFKLRLTRNGFVVVKMERAVTAIPLVEISCLTLEVQAPGRQPPVLPSQWQLAMEVAALFTEACDGQFDIPYPAGGRRQRVAIALSREYDHNPLPLHDRHICYLFHKISQGEKELDAPTLKAQYASHLVGLLENVVISGSQGLDYPRYKAQQLSHLLAADSASWEDEICILASEATFIFCPLAAQGLAFLSGGSQVEPATAYPDYWQAILRGVEHVVALKTELQLVERHTSALLEKIPDLTWKVTDGNLSRSDRQEILNLATGIATLFNLLPEIRTVLVPSSVFRASYAARKFERLMQLLGIQEIEHHIETNVQELNAFLSHYNSMALQQDAQNTNNRMLWLTVVFSVLTAAFSVLSLPSFFQDADNVNWWPKTLAPHWQGLVIGVINLPLILMVIIALSAIGFAVIKVVQYRKSRTRRRY
jgi:hypothetical protein